MGNRFMSRALVLLVLCFGSACAPAHVQLATVPDADAPLEERLAFYEEHQPVLIQTAPDLAAFTPPSSVQLNNGARVYHPADLLPLVDETSPTAEAVRRHEAAEHSLALWRTMGIGVSVVALGGLLASVLVFPDALPLIALAGSGATTLVTLPVHVLTIHFASTAAMERETAFLTYDRSLRDLLALHSSRESTPPPPLLQRPDPSAVPSDPGAPRDPVDVLCAALPPLDVDSTAPSAP